LALHLRNFISLDEVIFEKGLKEKLEHVRDKLYKDRSILFIGDIFPHVFMNERGMRLSGK